MDLTQTTDAASDPGDPLAALRAVTSLRRLADQLEHERVANAIEAGHSWAEIATALGVCRQAVHKKHAKRLPTPRKDLR